LLHLTADPTNALLSDWDAITSNLNQLLAANYARGSHLAAILQSPSASTTEHSETSLIEDQAADLPDVSSPWSNVICEKRLGIRQGSYLYGV